MAKPGLPQAPVSLGSWWRKATRLAQKDTSTQGLHFCSMAILMITTQLRMFCISA